MILILSIVFWPWTGAATPPIANVGQIVQLSELKESSVVFLPAIDKPSVSHAQINTGNCRKANLILPPKTYMKLQIGASNGDEIFVVLRQIRNESRAPYCIVAALSPRELADIEWSAIPGDKTDGRPAMVRLSAKRFTEVRGPILVSLTQAQFLLEKRRSKK
jgi:hypothetical protein